MNSYLFSTFSIRGRFIVPILLYLSSPCYSSVWCIFCVLLWTARADSRNGSSRARNNVDAGNELVPLYCLLKLKHPRAIDTTPAIPRLPVIARSPLHSSGYERRDIVMDVPFRAHPNDDGHYHSIELHAIFYAIMLSTYEWKNIKYARIIQSKATFDHME